MSDPALLVGEVFSHAEGLSHAHTVLEFTDDIQIDGLSPSQILFPEQSAVLDIGHYKEGDFAIWSILRIASAGRRSIMAARMRRIGVIDSTEEGFPIDLLVINEEEDSDTLRLSRVEGLTVRPSILDFIAGEFSFPQKAIQSVLSQGDQENNEGANDTALVQSSATAHSQVVRRGEHISSCPDDSDTREMLSALNGLEVGQRYVGRSLSENEALAGRDKTAQLLGNLDSLYEKMSGGTLFGILRIDLDDKDLEVETWGGTLPTGATFTLSRVPREDEPTLREEIENDIASGVEPPSVIVTAADHESTHSFRITIQERYTLEQRTLLVDGNRFTIQDHKGSPLQIAMEDESQSSDPHRQPLDKLGAGIKLQHSQLAESNRYLPNKEIEQIIDLLVDTSVQIEAISDFVNAKEEHGLQAAANLPEPTPAEKARLLALIDKYPEMPEDFRMVLQIKAYHYDFSQISSSR